MMDIQSALVCVLVFVVSGTILFLISMFGMREKSYEEALAEQRQLTGGLLQQSGGKFKSKDKKPKKTGKKVKEKSTYLGGGETKEIVDDGETKEEQPIAAPISPHIHHAATKLHVEFEEPAVVDVPVTKDKVQKKQKKVKPILINKEKTPVVETPVKLPLNHFEKIHPKDEYEMLHAEVKEEVQVKQLVKVKETMKQAKEKKQVTATPAAPSTVLVEETIEPSSAVTNNHNGNTVKDKKKKKSEFNTLQQMTASDKPGVNVSLLVPLVRKADLSRSEIQILIDLLLNKQHDGPTIIDEWSEGRSDPVQKLKKQLAEKDRLLNEEQEALVSAQAKLREVRAELNAERSRLLQNYRNLEETVHAKHTELQTVGARLLTQNQKMQQLQSQLNEEAQVSHKLRQELNQMQMQRQQMDMHLNQQKQEVESTFQMQVTQLRAELQEQQTMNAQLNMEIRNLRDTGHAEKELLSERVRQVEREATQYKNESSQRELMQRQLEDYRKMLQNKILTLESEKAQLEAANNGAQSKDNTREIEILNLQNELASQRVRLQQQEKQYAQEVDDLKNKIRTFESEIQTQKNKNDDLRKKNWKMVEALNIAEATITKHNSNNINLKTVKTEEQEKCQKFVQRLFPDMKLSNNDTNWMTDAEHAIKKFIHELEKKCEEQENTTAGGTVDIVRLQQQVAQYRNIIEDTEGMLNKLQSHIEIEEINWRKQLQSKDSELEVLKEQCKNQNKICEHEIGHSPSDEHGVKFAFGCIERSLPLITEELQNKIGELEEQLTMEQTAKRELELECEALKVRINEVPVTHAKHTQFNPTGLEEENRLATELLNEQKRCQELSEELLRLKSSSSTKVVQNHTNGTSIESADLPNNSASSSSVSPTSTKPRNKKNKKKATVNN